MKRNKGITLIALVVTIIILIILASVSFTLIMGRTGIFYQMTQAKELSKMGEYKERIDLILSEEVTRKSFGK